MLAARRQATERLFNKPFAAVSDMRMSQNHFDPNIERPDAEGLDPVCHMTVPLRSPKGGSHEFLGTVYVFCNPRCRDKFAADPERYLYAQAPSLARPDTRWVCPMCPEVNEAAPVPCPKCGMALDPTDLDVTAPPAEENPELEQMKRRFYRALGLALPVVALEMGGMLFLQHQTPRWSQGLQGLLASLTLWQGRELWRRGLVSFKDLRLNMFSLVTLGVFAAYVFSLLRFVQTLRAAHTVGVYFETAASITVLLLLGQVLELGARQKTMQAMRALVSLLPQTARRVFPSGEERDVPLSELYPGHRIRVLPYQKVAADGVLQEGQGELDETLLTGESRPVPKQVGDTVIGGAQNGPTPIVVRLTAVGADSFVGQIVQAVQKAQRSRAPVLRLVDQVSAWFVPVVVAVSVLTFGAWLLFAGFDKLPMAVLTSVSVLIVACPCALGLATPMSLQVASMRGALMGLLFREAAALERLALVNTVVFDKTGTLTLGKPVVAALLPAEGFTEEQLLAAATALEQGSEHSLARAVVEHAKAQRLTVAVAQQIVVCPGRGLTGLTEQGPAVVGNAALLAEQGVCVPPDWLGPLALLEQEGQTVIQVAVAGVWRGAIAVHDPLRTEAKAAVDELAALGLQVIMATGDNVRTAQAVAKNLQLGGVYAELTPDAKADLLRSLRQGGRVVAMVGDGINDAQALAHADVGVAMADGTDLARQSAALTLCKSDLRLLKTAVLLSQKTRRNIAQNLWLAFGYNVLAVPVAAGVLYPWLGLALSPMIASGAMSLSSLSVIANALRLRAVELTG